MSEPVPESVENERLTDALKRLLSLADGRPMAVRKIVEVMQGRGMHMIILLLCLPFLSPISIPGLSLPFGIAIMVCGFRVAFGHKPWFPDFIMRRELSFRVLQKMVGVGCAIYARVEKLVRPRWAFFFEGPGMQIATGLAVALAGLLLSLPIPPPFPLTNTIPGFALIFLSLGLIERDGILLLVGYVLTFLGALYMAAIATAGVVGVESLRRWFIGG